LRILVTGVYGFIGSTFAKMAIELDHQVVGFSRYSSVKNMQRLNSIVEHRNFTMINGDLSNPNETSEICEDVDVVVNFAAKSFVNHSILDPRPFIDSNIIGTFNLLESFKKYKPKRLIHVGTDEVYGSILKGSHTEDSPLNPGNPYSSSKASADMLCLSYFNTYDVPVIITRCENNFGPFQHQQKAVPVWIKKTLNQQPIPLYGDGQHIRQWLHVQDHCFAIFHLIDHGQSGEIYNIAANQERTNREIVELIFEYVGNRCPIDFIPDEEVRPGHDRRYSIDSSKLRALGWEPRHTIDSGFKHTVDWFKLNAWWWFK